MNQFSVAIPKIDQVSVNPFHTATFSMGCFWGPDALFGIQPGVIRTRVGYAGGKTSSPTYHQIGDHIETIQVDYNPAVVDFNTLLSLFWNNHSPTKTPYKRQYTSALFFHDETQQKIILDSKQAYSKTSSNKILTEIIPYQTLYLAENYHQKFHLQRIPELIDHFNRIYPDFRDIINSTAAARVNGYAGGYGHYENLVLDIDTFGLSKSAANVLKNLVR